MSVENRKIVSLIFWVAILIGIGWLLGSLSRSETTIWYTTLSRSPLTPPNYVFSIVWTFLYALIGATGWMIWEHNTLSNTTILKRLFIAQLLLNWSWTPLFFNYHLVGLSLFVLLSMNILVALIIWQSWVKIKTVAILMTPYFLWGILASYLNFYIWWHN